MTATIVGSRKITQKELSQASGLNEDELAELETYGIVRGRLVGGVMHYDELEMSIARVASAFRQFGIEPRHLRQYKHSADRETGFVEQLVLPLLKQRNPDARTRAAELADDLTALGQELRSQLVKRGLQDLLGG